MRISRLSTISALYLAESEVSSIRLDMRLDKSLLFLDISISMDCLPANSSISVCISTGTSGALTRGTLCLSMDAGLPGFDVPESPALAMEPESAPAAALTVAVRLTPWLAFVVTLPP